MKHADSRPGEIATGAARLKYHPAAHGAVHASDWSALGRWVMVEAIRRALAAVDDAPANRTSGRVIRFPRAAVSGATTRRPR